MADRSELLATLLSRSEIEDYVPMPLCMTDVRAYIECASQYRQDASPGNFSCNINDTQALIALNVRLLSIQSHLLDSTFVCSRLQVSIVLGLQLCPLLCAFRTGFGRGSLPFELFGGTDTYRVSKDS